MSKKKMNNFSFFSIFSWHYSVFYHAVNYQLLTELNILLTKKTGSPYFRGFPLILHYMSSIAIIESVI